MALIVSFSCVHQISKRVQMRAFHSILFVFLVLNVFGQSVTFSQSVNSNDTATREVMHLIENYLTSNPEAKGKNLYWSEAEQEKHADYDFLESEFQPSLYMGYPVQVLSISFSNDIAKIKAQFSGCNADGSLNVLAIVNYVALKEKGRYKLSNWLTFKKEEWNCTTVGVVDFYYPSYHKFDYDKAYKLNDFIQEICQNFDVPSKPFEYYLANEYDEIQELKGFDYYLGMGGYSMPSGKSTSDKVYCAGLGEYYPHEVFHLLVNETYSQQHFWASEGIATLLGGSRGKSLKWHLKRTNVYLQKHPEIDLSNMLELINLDNKTAFHYVLGGLIAKKVQDKGGWDLLKLLLNSGSKDEDYYRTIQELLGVDRKALNAYIREQLAIESK